MLIICMCVLGFHSLLILCFSLKGRLSWVMLNQIFDAFKSFFNRDTWIWKDLVDNSAIKLWNIKTFFWGVLYTNNRSSKLYQLYILILCYCWVATLGAAPWWDRETVCFFSSAYQRCWGYVEKLTAYFVKL